MHFQEMKFVTTLLTILPFVFCQQLASQSNGPRISIPFFTYINSSAYNNGFGAGLGFRYNDHEIGLTARKERWIGQGVGLFYRWYLPKSNLPCEPYITLSGVRNIQQHFFHIIGSSDYYPGRFHGIWAGFGVDFRILKAIRIYGAIGAGWDRIKVIGYPIRGTQFTGNFNFGLRYDLRIRGSRDLTWTTDSLFSNHEKFWVSMRGGIWKNQPFGEKANVYPSLELKAFKIFHPYVGLFFGGVDSTRFTNTKRYFAIKGLGTGLRCYTFSRRKVSVFQDIGYIFARNREWNYYGSRFCVGNSISYRVVPGLDAFAGMYLNFLRYEHYYELSGGLRLSPQAWFQRNL